MDIQMEEKANLFIENDSLIKEMSVKEIWKKK